MGGRYADSAGQVGRRLNWLLVGVCTVSRDAKAKIALLSSMLPLATRADPDQM